MDTGSTRKINKPEKGIQMILVQVGAFWLCVAGAIMGLCSIGITLIKMKGK